MARQQGGEHPVELNRADLEAHVDSLCIFGRRNLRHAGQYLNYRSQIVSGGPQRFWREAGPAFGCWIKDRRQVLTQTR